jgi:hypothetical protein
MIAVRLAPHRNNQGSKAKGSFVIPSVQNESKTKE